MCPSPQAVLEHFVPQEETRAEDRQRAVGAKGCSTSLGSREMQIQSIMRSTSHRSEWRFLINQQTSAGEDVEKREALVHCWWQCRLVQPLWKTVWNVLRKLKMELPFDPVIPFLSLYTKNPESPIQKNLCSQMFTAALFTIAKWWKQPKSLSVNDWIKKLWYANTMEYYEAERKNYLS